MSEGGVEEAIRREREKNRECVWFERLSESLWIKKQNPEFVSGFG